MNPARALLTGALTGALVLSAVVTLLHAVLLPDLLRDGACFFYWTFLTGPFGAVLGGLAASAAAHGRRHGEREAGLIRVSGGGVVAFLFGLLLLWFLRLLLHGILDWGGFLRGVLPLLGTPFAWALLLVSHGSAGMAAARAAATPGED